MELHVVLILSALQYARWRYYSFKMHKMSQKSAIWRHRQKLVVAQAHHAHDIINPYFTNKNT